MDKSLVNATDAELFFELVYYTAGNWDLDAVATAVEYIRELQKPIMSVVKND